MVVSYQNVIVPPTFFNEGFSVKQFGAKGDWITDDTIAIQTALTAAANKRLYIPAGIYKLSAQLYLADAAITIEGDGIGVTELRWITTSGSRGISIVSNDARHTHQIRDMTLSTSSSTVNGTAITLDYSGQMIDTGSPTGWTTVDRIRPRFLLANLLIAGGDLVDSGDAFGNSWQKGIDVIAGLAGNVVNCIFCGTATTAYLADTTTYGLTFRGSASAYSNGHPVQFVVRDCTIWFAQNGVTFDNCEGCYVAQSNLVAVNVGVFCTSVSGHPQLNVANTHVNASQIGVYVSGQSQVTISGCLIYCIQTPTTNFVGIYLDAINYFQTVNNTFASTNTTAFDVNYIVALGNSAYGAISNNVFLAGPITCIWLQAGTNHCKGSNNIFTVGGYTNSVLDSGTANAVT